MENVRKTLNIDLQTAWFTISASTLITVILSVAYFVSWKTEVDLAMKRDTVSPSAFASMQTDISYMKDDMKFVKSTLQQMVEKKN